MVIVDFDEYYRERYPTEFDDLNYRWHPRNPIAMAYRHQLERAVLRALSAVTDPLESLQILDVGCGSGAHLRLLLELGASLQHLHGVDLLEARVAKALSINPAIDIRCTDATGGLPFASNTFDLVTQFVAFSSILDHDARRAVAAEMLRVLAPRGWVLTYDTVVPKAGQVPDGLSSQEVEDLFPGITWVSRRALHHRGLAKLARWPVLAEAVERIPGIPKTNLLLVGRRTS